MRKIVTLFAIFMGCEREPRPAEGTLVVHIDTNAPVLTSEAGRSVPLFDSVRIELRQANSDPDGIEVAACGSAENKEPCLREFTASEDQFRNFSFGIKQTDRSDLVLYVRMFPSVLASADIDPHLVVTVRAPIPPVSAEGVKEALVFLDVADVGAGVVTKALEPYTGAPSRVGTWPWAKRIPCASAPAPDEACVPGGAFWLGAASGALTTQAERSARRAIALSPYFLSTREVSVADMRAFLATTTDPSLISHVQEWSYQLDGSRTNDWCTYTKEPNLLEDYPVNCVTDTLARAYCQSRGGDLPTEAQFEYAAGGFKGLPFAWGLDIPGCDYAVYGKRTTAAEALFKSVFADASCVGPEGPGRAFFGGPQPPPASGKAVENKDAVGLPDGRVIRDLAGNLSEWTLDEYETRGEPCWQDVPKPNLSIDPLCKQQAALGARRFAHSRTIRGGSWLEGPPALASNYRIEREIDIAPEAVGAPHIGFRCARPASSPK